MALKTLRDPIGLCASDIRLLLLKAEFCDMLLQLGAIA